MTLDHKQRRLRHIIHLFVSFLGLLLRETDQKRVIYVNLKKNGENGHFCAPVHATGPCRADYPRLAHHEGRHSGGTVFVTHEA